jgi:hypothetical protein
MLCHGRGLNEVPGAAIRGITSCWEVMYGGFLKNILSVHLHMDLPLGQSDMFFAATKYSHILSRYGGNDVCEMILAKNGTDRSTVGRGCRSWRWTAGKEHHGKALASSRQPCESLRSPMGARPDAPQDGGRSHLEERTCLAAAVLRIIRRRKNPVQGVFGKYSRTQHFLWRGDSILVFDPPLP